MAETSSFCGRLKDWKKKIVKKLSESRENLKDIQKAGKSIKMSSEHNMKTLVLTKVFADNWNATTYPTQMAKSHLQKSLSIAEAC